jgi:hypothetical protein
LSFSSRTARERRTLASGGLRFITVHL